jgi:hypothetical protein
LKIVAPIKPLDFARCVDEALMEAHPSLALLGSIDFPVRHFAHESALLHDRRSFLVV